MVVLLISMNKIFWPGQGVQQGGFAYTSGTEQKSRLILTQFKKPFKHIRTPFSKVILEIVRHFLKLIRKMAGNCYFF